MDLPGNDRQLTLLHLRKTFSAYLKEDLTGHDQQIAAFDRLLPLFNRIMSMYTPDELAVQFKEILSFCHQLCHLLVHEIRRRANIENTREAATSVYDLLRPSPPDSRGWVILKSITFIVNSGAPKVMDPVCKSMLPSTLVKLVYLFFDLPPLESGPENGKNAQEADLRSRLYDSLVTLMNSLCAYTAVAEELIQKDDLVLLFVGASSTSPLAEHTVWRDANFTFLCTIVSKALSSAVVKYIHSKGCIGHYLKNVRSTDLSQQEKVVLLGNMLDLLRSSAETTRVLIDDFGSANGYQTIVEFCCSSQTTMEECGQVFHALSGLITAGDETVQFNQPATQLSFYNFKLPQTLSRSTATVRVPDAYLVLEKCFYDGSDELCLLVLDLVSKLYKSERMNYFIVDKYYSLYLLVERMVAKGRPVQQKVLELVEFVLRELNFIPCKELTALSVHIKRAISSKDYDTLEQWLNFLFKILPININVKDAFRELSILEILLYIVQKAVLNESEEPEAMKKDDHPKKWSTTQMAMDLLVVATKGNVLNAQFVTESLEMRTIKAILVESKDSDQRISEELRTAILVLIKNLLYLAKNEQLFSSLLQLLFSDPGNIPMCSIILKLFTTVLLESHKVRIMFRKSGGYICLMTLLLHLEGALLSRRDKAQETLKNLNSEASNLQHQPSRQEILTHIAMIFHVFVVSMRYEPSNAKYFLTEVRPTIVNSILRSVGCFSQTALTVDVSDKVWADISLEKIKDKLTKVHKVFQLGEKVGANESTEIPQQITDAFFLLRLLFDLALDNYEKQSNDIVWAEPSEWLRSAENLETIPLVSWSNRTILVHPSAVLCILQLLPSISVLPDSLDSADSANEWKATAQFYMSLVLKALLRSERNQQLMCQHDMPKILLEVGADLFKTIEAHHPLVAPFHYMFERLACQSMHPAELRKFLRLDQPLCCGNLDDCEECEDVKEKDKETKPENSGGGPVPIHRVKALVSMLTPRNHSLVHPPAFVEFDMAIEGFACLFVPSLVGGPSMGQVAMSQSGSGSLSMSDRQFPPQSGFTYMSWIYVDECSTPPSGSSTSSHTTLPITLLSVVRNFEGTEISAAGYGNRRTSTLDTTPNLENHLTCLQIQLYLAGGEARRTIMVSTAEHSVVDELRKDFARPIDSYVSVPLSEQYFHLRQWTHLAVVMSKHILGKQGQVDIYVNGRCLASNKLSYFANTIAAQAHIQDLAPQPIHAVIGTPPFLRKAANLRWRMASMHLIGDALSVETIRRVIALQPHYVGNLQAANDGITPSTIVSEDKIMLSLNGASAAELTAHQIRSMVSRKADCEMVASLLGISSNDNATPLRVLWNTLPSNSQTPRSLGGIVVGYLGMRIFAPSPVSALLDSIGGVAPLLGLIAMCSDSHGLYASLKVLVSAVQTNRSIVNEVARSRGYQTLAMLLEEKAHLINSHILHLVLSLAGTVDASKTDESAIIPNLQIFDDLLCDLDVWSNAPEEVKKLLFEHFYELVIDNNGDNLTKVRSSSLLSRLLAFVFENTTLFPAKHDIIFRLIGAIVQPPCDSQSLLRLGQTIAATMPIEKNAEEKDSYPFHIAEMEKLLLESAKDGTMNESLYAVYVRNRLLNMIATTLAHSSGPVNSQLCESIVSTLGYGWVLALCAPGVHPGTLFLALKILVSLTKYPQLLEKFRDGTSNGGWLTDADSVIRNRAAVLLGFSVSAQGGAVGSHVDVNPELSNCSGFAALEHVMAAHADRPFAYLAILAILFNQHQANGIQPVEEFTIDMVWSHVFALNEKSSVAHAIQAVQFRPEALLPLLAMVRAGIHYRTNDDDTYHWSQNYPIMVLQLLTFLYQNSEAFFLICHTETFVVTLFTTLIPPPNFAISQAAMAGHLSFAEQNRQANESDLSPTSANDTGGRCVRHILELLTNILLNDLCLNHEVNNRSERLFDALVEYLDGGGTMCSQQSVLFSELVNACLDRFMSSNMFFANSALMVPQSAENQLLSHSSETTAINVVHFLSRVIDSVWNCLYRGNPIRILKCFLKLLAEAHASHKAAAQLTCTEAHINALFRIVLYLLSRPIDNVDTQMSVLDTLAEIVRNQHILLSPSKSNSSANPLFYGALVHLVFMLSEKPDIHHHDQKNHHLERGSAQVAMCAQSVWGMLWQQKKQLLDELFMKSSRDVDLDLYTARAVCGEQANRYWLQFVDSQTDGSASTSLPSSQPNSAKFGIGSGSNAGQIQSKLTKAARSGLQRLVSQTSRSGKSMLGSMAGTGSGGSMQQPIFQFERVKVESETFYMWLRVHLSLMKELMRQHCQRYHEWHSHVRKWCMQEWHNTEAELTRERGLWGPEQCSKLDKYQLDITEGPDRIRKKFVPDPGFYRRYPYRLHLDRPEAKPLRAKVAISKDSRLYYERMKRKRFHTMDERIVDNSIGGNLNPGTGIATQPQAQTDNDQELVDLTSELNLSMIKRMVQKNLSITQKAKLEKEKRVDKDDVPEEPGAALHRDEEEDEEDEDCMLDEETSDNHKAIEGGEESAEKAQESTQKPEPNAESKRSAPSSPSKSSQVQVKKKSQSPTTGPDNQTLLRLLEQGEQLHSMFRCARVQGLDTLEGLLLFGKDHYYVVDGFTLLKTREIRDLDFLPEQYHDPIIPYMAMGSTSRPTSTKSNRQCNKFSYDDIKEVHKRRYLLQPIAIEMFSADGRNYLLAFPRKIRDRVYNKLVSMAKSASSDVAKTMAEQKKLLPTESTSTSAQLINSLMGQQSMTQKWQRGECTNFHYLMYLNTLAGRSYNDLSQYPVFPWILKDYESDQLDLTNPAKTFRDLSRPMGAQTPERLSQFLKRFREWDDPTGDTPPYMYGTHYSSAMIVLSYLVRLEPFTQQFLKLQGGHFDLADRMFHSIRDAYVSASKNNMADVKELIPEFFYLPETFENSNAYDLGVKQSGLMLNDVQLPKWAHGDSHEFIRIHREALECDYVSEHLHEWIDLIFGYKQTGDAARDSNNVFHHLFYEQNVDFDNIDDPLTRNATLGFINNFGQVPAQLFKKPHPQRKVHPTSGSGSAGSSASGQSGNSSPQTSMVQLVRGVSTPKLFYHCLESLRPSTNKPVKELKAAIGDILVNEKGQVVVLEQNKILIPPTSFLAWGFHDRSIRVGGVGTDKSHCVLETNDVFEITCMASADGGKVIFGGLTTGTVLVWTLSGLHFSGSSGSSSSSKGHSALRLHPRRALDAHTDVVTALATCPAHNFIVSASRDQTAVIWHLTRLTFIRQLKGHSGAVTAVAVNDVIGDIATASGAQLFLWTLNGVLLASINTAEAGLFTNPSSLILCLGFSTLNEWDLRNVVMCGTSDGLVKIYSCELRKIIVESSQEAHDLNHVENQSSAADPTSKAVKEHLLRRQQRIQNHNRRLASNRSSSSASSEVQSLSMSMGDPMSPLQPGPTSSEDSPFAGAYNGNAAGNNRSDSKLAEIEWKRALHLRRVLSEHTAFSQGNAHPAPITSLRPTKDHKSLLVGDGVGRVWLWTIDNSATPGSNT